MAFVAQCIHIRHHVHIISNAFSHLLLHYRRLANSKHSDHFSHFTGEGKAHTTKKLSFQHKIRRKCLVSTRADSKNETLGLPSFKGHLQGQDYRMGPCSTYHERVTDLKKKKRGGKKQHRLSSETREIFSNIKNKR